MKDVDCHSKMYDEFKICGSTKLGNNLFALGLARRLRLYGVSNATSVACHPGFAGTSISLATGLATGFATVFAQKAERGAQHLLAAAVGPALGSGAYVAPEFEEVSGASRAGGDYSELSLRPSLQDKFWDLECKRLNLTRTWPAGCTLMQISKRAPPTPIRRARGADDKPQLHLRGFVHSDPPVMPVDTAVRKQAASKRQLKRNWKRNLRSYQHSRRC
jgi:hypothetical protein